MTDLNEAMAPVQQAQARIADEEFDALVDYHRNEARHMETAIAVGDRDTAEYGAIALATADAITALREERDQLRAENERLRALSDLIDQNITANSMTEHRLFLDGEIYTGPVVDWAHKVLTVLRDLIRGGAALQRKAEE